MLVSALGFVVVVGIYGARYFCVWALLVFLFAWFWGAKKSRANFYGNNMISHFRRHVGRMPDEYEHKIIIRAAKRAGRFNAMRNRWFAVVSVITFGGFVFFIPGIWELEPEVKFGVWLGYFFVTAFAYLPFALVNFLVMVVAYMASPGVARVNRTKPDEHNTNNTKPVVSQDDRDLDKMIQAALQQGRRH